MDLFKDAVAEGFGDEVFFQLLEGLNGCWRPDDSVITLLDHTC